MHIVLDEDLFCMSEVLCRVGKRYVTVCAQYGSYRMTYFMYPDWAASTFPYLLEHLIESAVKNRCTALSSEQEVIFYHCVFNERVFKMTCSPKTKPIEMLVTIC